MKLNPVSRLAIRTWSQVAAERGEEACGFLLLAAGTLERCWEVRNVHAQPATAYAIADVDVAWATLEAGCVDAELVVWHAHVSEPATPSTADLEGAGVGNLLVIYSVLLDELRAYRVERTDDDRYRQRLRAVDVAIETA